ncbi:uncharacterized protein LOC135810854 [Sycon ciliatum]|uniref:uncharacterized protein LOC135810854 n=1 Tax=Sycon ciliatum TaxID=27933 RepID=UPI0020AEB910|eukprot:scpid91293/ scgid11461/ 
MASGYLLVLAVAVLSLGALCEASECGKLSCPPVEKPLLTDCCNETTTPFTPVIYTCCLPHEGKLVKKALEVWIIACIVVAVVGSLGAVCCCCFCCACCPIFSSRQKNTTHVSTHYQTLPQGGNATYHADQKVPLATAYPSYSA